MSTALSVTFLPGLAVAQVEGWVTHRVALAPNGEAAVFGRYHNEDGRGELVSVGPEGRRVLCRAGVVRGIAVLPDDGGLLSTCDRGEVWLTGADGERVRTYDLGWVSGFVREVVVSASGRRLWVIDDENRLQCFAVTSGERLWGAQLERLPTALACLPDDEVMLADRDGGLTVWSADGEAGARQDFDGLPMALAVDGSSRRVALGMWDGSVVVVDRRSWEELEVPEHQGRVYALRFDATGERLAIAGSAGGVTVWDLRGETVKTTVLATPRSIGALRFVEGRLVGADHGGGLHRFATAGG